MTQFSLSHASRSLGAVYARVVVAVSLVLATAGVALAQEPLARKDILIAQAWPPRTTLSNYNHSGHAGARTVWFTCPEGFGDPDVALPDRVRVRRAATALDGPRMGPGTLHGAAS